MPIKELRSPARDHLAQIGRVIHRDGHFPHECRLLRGAPRAREGFQVLFQLVPQPHTDAVAVHDVGDRDGQALCHLLAGPGLRKRMGEREQRADLIVPARGLLQRHRHVEHRRGVLGIQPEELFFLREELDRAWIARDQLSVLPPGRGDLHDQHRVVHDGLPRERGEREVPRLQLVEAVAVDLQLGFRPGTHGQDVARGAHCVCGALNDATQYRLEVVGRHQIAGGRVGALQSLGHRHELGLQRGHALLGIGGGRGQLGIPGNRVQALPIAARLALALLDTGERKPEQDRKAREQPRGPVAVQPTAGEALTRAGHDHATPGGGFDGLHLRHGA